MTRSPICRLGRILFPLLLLLSSICAGEPVLGDLLRDGLYAEEVSRDPTAAAKHYEQVLARYSEHRNFAATALFRLAEVRRKQDRTDDAILLYQRLLAEFPSAANEAKLARENLAALGGKPPEVKGPAADPESMELARLQLLAKTAPDIILGPMTLANAAEKGWSKVVAYLMASGSQPFDGDALRFAVKEGYLEIVKQMMADRTPIPADKATDAIWAAMEANRHTILEFLLEKGLKPGKKRNVIALTHALLEGKMRAAELFIKFGVDLNETSDDYDGMVFGTALAIMICKNNFDAADWLLAKGAKPDKPDPRWNISALHYATLGKTERNFEMMQRLLEAGADPNRRAIHLNSESADKASSIEGGFLLTAIRSGYKIEDKVRLLLKYKLDPSVKISFKGTEQSLLEGLSYNWFGNEGIQIIHLLIEAGAKPDEKWVKNNFWGVDWDAREILIEKFTLPKLISDSEIHLLIKKPEDITTTKIAVRSREESPPDLGTWLLANHTKHSWILSFSVEYQWSTWRKNGEGVLTKQALDFASNAALSSLHWGDIIECQIKRSENSLRSYSTLNGLSPQTIATLRKRVSFPISFEIEGKTRELMVRGDRVFFDPTKNEVPMKNLQGLVNLFWQMPSQWDFQLTIQVSRKGWPDVRLSYGSNEAVKFQLESGDQVSVEISDQVRDVLAAARKQNVMLKVDGYPFTKYFAASINGQPVPASIPTLIQMLTDAQCPLFKSNWNITTNTTEISYVFDEFTLLPHPDLSRIRIRRLNEDGAEKVIEVNLAKLIAASTNQTTAEEARNADVMLQKGDVVEVSLIKENLDKPWKGFSKQEEAFFAKALSGRVQVTDEEGNLSVRDLVFKSPHFVESDNNWIPMLPDTGMPSARGSWLVNQGTMSIKRGENQVAQDQSSFNAFLRDGDEISTRINGQQPIVPPPSR